MIKRMKSFHCQEKHVIPNIILKTWLVNHLGSF